MEGTPKTLALTPVVIGVSLRILLIISRGYTISVFNLLLIHNLFLWGEVEIVNIKPMLVRLQSAIGRDDLTEQMVLLPERKKPFSQEFKSPKIIVAYHGSPNSHTALDIALCIAQQTSLATNVQVNVQAVYVVENQHNQFLDSSDLESQVSQLSQSHLPIATQSNSRVTTQYLSKEYILPLQQADRVLWQARSLAEEWQSYFKSHLRFGCVATELKNVVELEAADILFLGCKSANHTMVQMLGSNFPCAVLGIPHSLNQ